VGTSKHVRGYRVSAISLPGCGTSMALATGPTDKEDLSVGICVPAHV